MSHIKLGRYNQLEIVKEVDFGVYLDGDEDGEILLPLKYVPEGSAPGDILNVFIYLDMEERLVATTQQPYAQVGDFACLEVAWVNEYGAFLDWGLMKDLFVPFREQKMRMEKDRSYIVYVYIDPESRRIVGSAKVEKWLEEARKKDYYRGRAVDLLVQQKTDLGFKVIVDNAHSGLLYDNQLYSELHTGDRLQGVVVNVRPDGKLDVSAQSIGKSRFRDFAEVLVEELEQAGGQLPFTDKSASEEIVARFGVSKKTFKQAVGTLYKARRIVLTDEGICLNRSGSQPAAEAKDRVFRNRRK